MRTFPSPPAGQDLNTKALRFRLRVRERLPRRLRALAPLFAPDPDLPLSERAFEYIYLDNAVARIVRPGMTCIDIGAFSGVYTKQFLKLGATAVAIEGYPPAATELRKRLGKNSEVIEALLADNERVYTINNKAEIRMIGNTPVYIAAEPGISGIRSTTYDQLFASEPQPDLVKISASNICETLLGAHTLLNSEATILFMFDPRYLPAYHRHDTFCLFGLLTRSERSIFTCENFIAGARPQNVWEFNKRATSGLKAFVAIKN